MTGLEYIELAGTITALLYLLLVTHRYWISWVFYILSSILYVPVFWDANLYADAVLQLFFLGMGLYALLSWRKSDESSVSVIRWPFKNVVIAGTVILLGGAAIGFFLSKTDAGGYAYFDATILVGSIITTILTAKKVYEGWWFWIAINCLATVIFGLKGLGFTTWLYGLYVILSVRAMFHWRKALENPPILLKD